MAAQHDRTLGDIKRTHTRDNSGLSAWSSTTAIDQWAVPSSRPVSPGACATEGGSSSADRAIIEAACCRSSVDWDTDAGPVTPPPNSVPEYPFPGAPGPSALESDSQACSSTRPCPQVYGSYGAPGSMSCTDFGRAEWRPLLSPSVIQLIRRKQAEAAAKGSTLSLHTLALALPPTPRDVSAASSRRASGACSPLASPRASRPPSAISSPYVSGPPSSISSPCDTRPPSTISSPYVSHPPSSLSSPYTSRPPSASAMALPFMNNSTTDDIPSPITASPPMYPYNMRQSAWSSSTLSSLDSPSDDEPSRSRWKIWSRPELSVGSNSSTSGNSANTGAAAISVNTSGVAGGPSGLPSASQGTRSSSRIYIADFAASSRTNMAQAASTSRSAFARMFRRKGKANRSATK